MCCALDDSEISMKLSFFRQIYFRMCCVDFLRMFIAHYLHTCGLLMGVDNLFINKYDVITADIEYCRGDH